ncbi:hypothetical protein [Aeromicrobium sp. UC242_57]|uniref:hypothetical protein n=1 Tax=Aeromicrobium sp. UC242_57 TaxID=3374624 RepID=UPI0037935D8E
MSSVGERIRLTAGEAHEVRIEYSAPALNTYQGGQVRLFWEHPERVMSPAMTDAVDTARGADTAVVVVRTTRPKGSTVPIYDSPRSRSS